MNLRDQFAMAIVQGMAANGGIVNAESVWAAADAMMESRGSVPQTVTPITMEESRHLSIHSQNVLAENNIWNYEQITAESLGEIRRCGVTSTAEILGWKNIQLGRRVLA